MPADLLPVRVSGSTDRLPVPWVPPAPGRGLPAVGFTRRPEALASVVADRTPPRLALPGHRMALLALPAAAATPAAPARAGAGVGARVLRIASGPRRAVRLAVKAALGLATLGLAFTVVGTLTGGWGLVPVLTGSMRPGIQPGDAVFVTPEPLSAVRAGQVLVFQPPGEGGASVVHRVIAVSGGPTGPVIRTKGDANNVADPWRAQLGGGRAWRVRAVVPRIGYLTVAEHNPDVRLALEALLVLAGLGIGLTVIWKPETSPDDRPDAAGAPANVGAA